MKPHAVTEMRRPDLRGRKRPDLKDKAKLSEIGDNLSGVLFDTANVLQENENWRELVSEPNDFSIEAATRSAQANTQAALADVLAGESAIDDVDGNGDVCASECSHIVPNWCGGKLTIGHSAEEHTARIGVDLAVGDWAHPRSEGDGEPANSAE